MAGPLAVFRSEGTWIQETTAYSFSATPARGRGDNYGKDRYSDSRAKRGYPSIGPKSECHSGHDPESRR